MASFSSQLPPRERANYIESILRLDREVHGAKPEQNQSKLEKLDDTMLKIIFEGLSAEADRRNRCALDKEKLITNIKARTPELGDLGDLDLELLQTIWEGVKDILTSSSVCSSEPPTKAQAAPASPLKMSRAEYNQYARAIQTTEVRRVANGLYNLGGTCWLNATLQASFKPGFTLRAQLENQARQGPQKERCQELLEVLRASENQDASFDNNVYLLAKLTKFVEKFYGQYGLQIGVQDDATYAFELLVQYLELSNREAYTVMECEFRKGKVGHESLTKIADSNTNEGSVALLLKNPTNERSSTSKLAQLLCTQVEEMKGENLLNLDGVFQEGYKQYFLGAGENPPEQLIFQIPRFTAEMKIDSKGNRSFQTRKLQTPIDIDDTIKLVLCDPKTTKPTQLLTLQVKSIVTHKGSLNAGHYQAFTKKGDTWVNYNDSQVKDVQGMTERKQGKDIPMSLNDYFARYGFMAVYERVKVQPLDSSRLPSVIDSVRALLPQAPCPDAHGDLPVVDEDGDVFFAPENS